MFESSGAILTLEFLPDAEHKLDSVEAAIEKQDGVTLAEKIVRFFGLAKWSYCRRTKSKTAP